MEVFVFFILCVLMEIEWLCMKIGCSCLFSVVMIVCMFLLFVLLIVFRFM